MMKAVRISIVFLVCLLVLEVEPAPRTLRQSASGNVTVSASNNFFEKEMQRIQAAGENFINQNRDAANKTMDAVVKLVDAGLLFFGSFPRTVAQYIG